MKRALLSRWLRSRRGSAAVEFSFIAPVLILLGGGVYEIGRAFQSASAVNRIASQYALAWADCVDLPAGACNSELGTYTTANGLKNLAPELTNPVTLQMFQVVMSGTNPTVSYSYPNSTAMTAAQKTAAATVLADKETGVVVTVSYTYTVDIFPKVVGLPATIPLTYTVVQLKA